MLSIGIIREGKNPPDSRVPLNPAQCVLLERDFPIKVVVQPYPSRCFSDDEFLQNGVTMQEDLSFCDILMGVKEVPVDQLIPNKTYFFFSHTIKAQPYNRKLLKAVLAKNIRLIDYEVLTDEQGQRLIAFGKFAGMVGAHNALYTYAQRSGQFPFPRMKDLRDYAEALEVYGRTLFPPIKIILTGSGRVGEGSARTLRDMGIREVSPQDFLHQQYDEAVFTILHSKDYVARRDGQVFTKPYFYSHPAEHVSIFWPYTRVADVFINGVFWDHKSPVFFTREEMQRPDFHIKVIADVTCDLAPLSSVPSTLKASTIADPVFGYMPSTGLECAPYQAQSVDVMSIDNLPNELPRDASTAFGSMFILQVVPELFKPYSSILERATIAENGQLCKRFGYLQGYVEGSEPL